MKVKAVIERGSDSTYGIYIDLDENRLSYGIIVQGVIDNTLTQAVSIINLRPIC